MEGTEPDPPKPENASPYTEVVGEYDSVDGTDAFVVADIARDDAWLAMSVEAVIDLENVQ